MVQQGPRPPPPPCSFAVAAISPRIACCRHSRLTAHLTGSAAAHGGIGAEAGEEALVIGRVARDLPVSASHARPIPGLCRFVGRRRRAVQPSASRAAPAASAARNEGAAAAGAVASWRAHRKPAFNLVPTRSEAAPVSAINFHKSETSCSVTLSLRNTQNRLAQ